MIGAGHQTKNVDAYQNYTLLTCVKHWQSNDLVASCMIVGHVSLVPRLTREPGNEAKVTYTSMSHNYCVKQYYFMQPKDENKSHNYCVLLHNVCARLWMPKECNNYFMQSIKVV